MNSNKISCLKHVFKQNDHNSSLELSVKFASQICHENINKPLDGAYLADFGIDINTEPISYATYAPTPSKLRTSHLCEPLL